MPYADLKRGFLSDSLQESPQEIGIADRPEAERWMPCWSQVSHWAGIGRKVAFWTIIEIQTPERLSRQIYFLRDHQS
ncbi:MAG: hypothetical protein V2B13_19100 [Pseudomonadota bacterium]